ncbi:FCD domain-containing protein [Alcaligenaceae bacterium]|nr:FCD domain-containing protein [Alcaligenaceae bacterium]
MQSHTIAARLATQHASDAELSILEDLCEQYKEAIENDTAVHVKNRQFHDMLCQCAHNRYLISNVNILHDSLSLLGPSVLSQRERALETLAEQQAR